MHAAEWSWPTVPWRMKRQIRGMLSILRRGGRHTAASVRFGRHRLSTR